MTFYFIKLFLYAPYFINKVSLIYYLIWRHFRLNKYTKTCLIMYNHALRKKLESQKSLPKSTLNRFHYYHLGNLETTTWNTNITIIILPTKLCTVQFKESQIALVCSAWGRSVNRSLVSMGYNECVFWIQTFKSMWQGFSMWYRISPYP